MLRKISGPKNDFADKGQQQITALLCVMSHICLYGIAAAVSSGSIIPGFRS
jgi:hypothetical protein